MKKQRVACLSYHKYPGEDWREKEFQRCEVQMPSGEKVEMRLAERGSRLNNNLWVREIRKLTQRGHQTSLICIDYRSEMTFMAIAMFSRWSQENFFKYLRTHYALDRLIDYNTEEISDTAQVVNPEYRQLDSQIRSSNTQAMSPAGQIR